MSGLCGTIEAVSVPQAGLDAEAGPGKGCVLRGTAGEAAGVNSCVRSAESLDVEDAVAGEEKVPPHASSFRAACGGLCVRTCGCRRSIETRDCRCERRRDVLGPLTSEISWSTGCTETFSLPNVACRRLGISRRTLPLTTCSNRWPQWCAFFCAS